MTLTERGRIQGGLIVLREPIALPEGTEVVVQIQTVPAAEAAHSPVSAAKLSRFAKQNPAPPGWWDAKDNPFES